LGATSRAELSLGCFDLVPAAPGFAGDFFALGFSGAGLVAVLAASLCPRGVTA
jgi:hypothetical protein